MLEVVHNEQNRREAEGLTLPPQTLTSVSLQQSLSLRGKRGEEARLDDGIQDQVFRFCFS